MHSQRWLFKAPPDDIKYYSSVRPTACYIDCSGGALFCPDAFLSAF